MKKVMKLNKRKILITIEIVILIALIGVLGVRVYKEFFSDFKEEPTNKVEAKEAIKEYGYILEDRDTKLFQTYYDQLKTVLKEKNVDYEKYADLLSKLFITDFYTLSNKLTSTDIGSLEFIHPNSVDNFTLNAGDTLYKTVRSNLYGERIQALPEVSDVKVDANIKTTFKYNETDYEAYEVKVSWTYIEDLGYDTTKTLILIKEDKKLYVVSSK